MKQIKSMNRTLQSQLISAAIGDQTAEIDRIVRINPECINDEEILARAIDSPSATSTIFHLLELGWNPNGRLEHFKQSAVSVAAKQGRSDIVAELIARGADVNAESQNGQNALTYTCQEKSSQHIECLKQLLAAGADPNLGRFISPLMWAVEKATPEMVNILLDAGAELERWYGSGNALYCAILANKPEMVRLLLAHGAKIEARVPAEASAAYREHPGMTLKEVAAKERRSKIISALEGYSPAFQSQLTKDVGKGWSELHKQLERAGVRIGDYLNSGASEAELSAFASLAGQPLPTDVPESYRRHNGQPHDCYTLRLEQEQDLDFLDGTTSLFRILPIGEIIDEVARLRTIRTEIDPTGTRYQAERGIVAEFCNDGWMPLARSKQGDILCCDTQPPKDGVKGQIVLLSSESNIRTRAAQTWSQCLTQFQFVDHVSKNSE